MNTKTSMLKLKGYISFIALVLVIISSLFVFYFINLTNTNALGVDVKHSLDRSTKGASACVNEEMLAKGFFKIDGDKAKGIFETLINKNLATEDKIQLTPIKQNNGVNYVYQYQGYEELTKNQSKLDETPRITFFVFNAENDIVSNQSEDVADFLAFIKSSLEQVQITNTDAEEKIKDGIFSELAGKKMNGESTGVEGKVTDTRSFVLAVAEIPVSTFNGSVGTMYRFSTARLNSRINTVQENTTVVKTGLLGRYHEYAIEKSGTVFLSPSQIDDKLAERIDKTVNLWVDNVLIIDKWREQSTTA